MRITAKDKLDRQIRRLSAATMFAITFSISLYFGLSLGQSIAWLCNPIPLSRRLLTARKGRRTKCATNTGTLCKFSHFSA